jgi:hypothetical protein
MKRLTFIILWGMLSSSFSLSNVGPQQAYLNEIYFDENGDWQIEIVHLLGIDSLRLYSSSGNSLISNYTPIYWQPFSIPSTVIGDTNLAESLYINPEGDYIKLVSYNFGVAQSDSMAFGNFPGSYLDCTIGNESFTAEYTGMPEGFTIDNSPTLGLPNDTTGTKGWISGILYRPNGDPFVRGEFTFVNYNTWIEVNPDGSFSQRMFSRRYKTDYIRYRQSYISPIVEYMIVPQDFCLHPDSSVQIEIFTTGFVKVEDKKKYFDHGLIVSPNPFTTRISFYLDYTVLPEEKLKLEILDQQGKILHSEGTGLKQKRIDWEPGEYVASGILIYRLSNSHQILTTGKIIKL